MFTFQSARLCVGPWDGQNSDVVHKLRGLEDGFFCRTIPLSAKGPLIGAYASKRPLGNSFFGHAAYVRDQIVADTSGEYPLCTPAAVTAFTAK